MAKQLLLNVLLVGVLVILGACGAHTQQMLEDTVSTDQKGTGDSVAKKDSSETAGLDGEGNLSIDILDEEDRNTTEAAGSSSSAGSAALEKVIYFDYNSSEVRDEFLPLIIRIVKILGENPAMQARLEGHADERGTREYNLALGERRAQEVRNLILLQGIHDDQVSIVSYGEEKPAIAGSDEEFWQLNRRVELIY